MIQQEPFARDEILPSWWANRIQDRIAPLSNLRLDLSSTTTVRANAGANDDAMVVNVAGNWRKAEAAITRAHPGGGAGTYLVFVTAKAQTIVNTPLPNTDNTDYTFALAIVPNATTPTIVAGTVDIYRRVGHLTWDGAAITALVQEVGAVLGAQLDDATLVSGGVTATRQPGGGWLLDHAAGSISNSHISAGAAIAKSKLAALAIVDADVASGAAIAKAKLAALAIADADVASGAAIAESKLALASDAVAGTASRRTLGTGAQQAAAGTDTRFPAGVDIVSADLAAAVQQALFQPGDLKAGAYITAQTGWLLCDGTASSRTTFAVLFAATNVITTATRNGTITLTAIPSTTGWQVGWKVSGTGIAAGTTIASIVSGTSITLSITASGSGSGGALVVGPYGIGDGSTTFNVPDFRGRGLVGMGTHNNVNALSDSDGLVVANRIPQHYHLIDGSEMNTGPTGTAGALDRPASADTPGRAGGFQFVWGVAHNDGPEGGPAYGVVNWFIKT